MLRFCDRRLVAFASPRGTPAKSEVVNLEQLRAFFSRHLLPYGHFVGNIRRSFRSSIHGSARVLLNSFSRSEETASPNGNRDQSGESSSYFFHSATSLRCNRILASESSLLAVNSQRWQEDVTSFFRYRHRVVTALRNDETSFWKNRLG